MIMSEAIDQLATALSAAQAVMKGAAKDSTNPHFRNSYADLSSVWDACRAPLSENGLAIIQTTSTTADGVSVTTLLTHKSGQYISDTLTMPVSQRSPQVIGSAITYARRYALSAMVGIAPEDDDGEGAEARGQKPQEPTNKKPAEKKEPEEKKDPYAEFFARANYAITADTASAFAQKMAKAINLAPTMGAVAKLQADNIDGINSLISENEKLYGLIQTAVKSRTSILAQAPAENAA